MKTLTSEQSLVWDSRVRCLLSDVRDERERQLSKWGVQSHALPAWISFLAEELGEAAKEANEIHFGGAEGVNPHERLRKELIQVAALAIAIIQCDDQGEA